VADSEGFGRGDHEARIARWRGASNPLLPSRKREGDDQPVVAR
jgi:hypothetical protein